MPHISLATPCGWKESHRCKSAPEQDINSMMTREEMKAAADFLRKYVAAVETKLYWNMSTSEAKAEIKEAKHLATLLDEAAEKECN